MRKSYTVEKKKEILREVAKVGNAAKVAKKHGIKSTTIYSWKRKFGDHETLTEKIDKTVAKAECQCAEKDVIISKQKKIIDLLLEEGN